MVQLLIDNEAKINASWPLVAALHNGHVHIVQQLLENGADEIQSSAALEVAACSGNENIARLLIEHGARWHSPILAAAFEGHETIIQLLIESGTDPDMPRGEYGTALTTASFRGHESIVRLLLNEGADVNALGVGKFSSALQAGVFSGHEHIVQLLIDRGADVNQQVPIFGTTLARRCRIRQYLTDHLLPTYIDGSSKGLLGNTALARETSDDECGTALAMAILWP